MASRQFQVGFLGKKATYRFAGGSITPVPQYPAAQKWIARYAHEDGFIYPPVTRIRRDGQVAPNTERPSHLHRLSASHRLQLDSFPAAQQQRGDASFIMHLVGYPHGTWL